MPRRLRPFTSGSWCGGARGWGEGLLQKAPPSYCKISSEGGLKPCDGAVCPSKESVLQPVGVGESVVNTHAPEGRSFHGSPGAHLGGRYELGATYPWRFCPPNGNLICLAQCRIFSARNNVWCIVGTQQWC